MSNLKLIACRGCGQRPGAEHLADCLLKPAGLQFKVGDIVTRDGSDRQRILEINDGGDLMEVECIRAPTSGWCNVGDREWNLTRRYDWADEPIDVTPVN